MSIAHIFRSYYRPLCLYALHYVQDVAAAEDIVQDCFAKLLQITPLPDQPRAWLYSAVRNAAIDGLRNARFVTSPNGMEGQRPDDDNLLTDEETQERSLHEAELWAAIDGLPTRCREIFLLAKRDGLTYRAIAQQLGISERTVEHQVSKALRVLRGKSDSYFYSIFLFA